MSPRPRPRLGRCADCGEPGALRANSCVRCWEENDRAEVRSYMRCAALVHELWPDVKKWESSGWLPLYPNYAAWNRRAQLTSTFALRSRMMTPLDEVKRWRRACDLELRRQRQEHMAGIRTSLNLPPYPLVRRDSLDGGGFVST